MITKYEYSNEIQLITAPTPIRALLKSAQFWTVLKYSFAKK